MSYEAGTSRTVRALHVMPGMPGPEGELHHHDYRVEVVASRDQLDERGMVCDLDVLRAELARVLDSIEGKDLEAIRPPDADAVTVEVFATWVHGELSGPLAADGAEHLSVRVWESESEFGGYSAPTSSR